MSYREKFAASEHRAHYKNIATKILRDMNHLRAMVENSPTASRRWVWELIQNAKDVHPQHGTHIFIDHNPNNASPYLKFLHNGRPFTADNIRFLIEHRNLYIICVISSFEYDIADTNSSQSM